jgi:ABC-type transport system involved in cytochrome bd biosynthesis fused ATPase/permease subunit
MLIKILKIFNSVSGNLRYKIFYFQFLIFLNSIAQLLSIVSIGPLIMILSDNNLDTLYFLQPLFNLKYFDQNKESLTILFSIFILIIFTISNILSLITNAIQQRIAQQFDVELSTKIVKNFFYQRQDTGVAKNSFYFKSLVEKEVPNLISHAIIPLLDLNSKVFPLALILATILYISPNSAIVIFFLFSLSFAIIYSLIKNKLKKNSILISRYLSENTIIVDDLFKSFKESKVFNFEHFLINSFVIFKKKITKIIGTNLILHSSPKHFLEIIAIFVLVGTIVIFSLNSEFSSSLHIISIYVVAGYRIMPSLQSILFAVSNMKGSTESLNKLYHSIFSKSDSFKSKTNKKIEIDKLSINNFNFKYNNKIIFKNCNIEFKKNTITGLSGESGSGKSTLIDLLVGFKKIYKGSIKVNDILIPKNINRIYKYASIVSQNTFLLNDNLIKNITFKEYLNNSDYKKLLQILKILKLKNLYKDNKIINKNIKEFGKNFSGGQIQRIGLARALFKESEIVILDEFTSALDKNTEKFIFKNIIKLFKNKIIIIISHRDNILKKCDIIFSIKNYKIIKTPHYK